MNVIIIDDEADARENLQNLLNKYCANVNVIATGDSAVSGLEAIKENKPDLVFLDIQMPDGSGLDLLEQIKEIDFEIVFVTAFDEYAIKAIKFCALDYILKPINILELKAAVDKASDKLSEKNSKDKLKVFIDNQNQKPKKIALSTIEGIIFVSVADIIRCEASDAYTTFFLINGDKIMISVSLKEYENLLSDSHFFRVHQSHLVNLEYVKKYVKGTGGYIMMSDDSKIGISRSKKHVFLEKLTAFNSLD